MPEHELWFTKFLNDVAAIPAEAALELVGLHGANPARPWTNVIAMQLLVVAILIAVFGLLRPRLSADRPGKFQQIFEVIYEFLHEQAEENVGHGGARFLPLFGTLFFFILFANLIGVVPGFESPTMFPSVPAGCALVAFLYYNAIGVKEMGAGKYIGHFAGPMPALAPLMFPIEIISHCARPLSLTIRLFANMYAGEQVTIVFLSLTYLVAPALFMGLHVFVSFLQAYIFALMTMIYVSGSVEHH